MRGLSASSKKQIPMCTMRLLRERNRVLVCRSTCRGTFTPFHECRTYYLKLGEIIIPPKK